MTRFFERSTPLPYDADDEYVADVVSELLVSPESHDVYGEALAGEGVADASWLHASAVLPAGTSRVESPSASSSPE